ncbi:hypothetical protein [Nannocystis pusilla]|uniref:hypothetical protein n=1 Tax=Nannocystis pusilla TaxID=889268 RepID=UPI003B819A6F
MAFSSFIEAEMSTTNRTSMYSQPASTSGPKSDETPRSSLTPSVPPTPSSVVPVPSPVPVVSRSCKVPPPVPCMTVVIPTVALALAPPSWSPTQAHTSDESDRTSEARRSCMRCSYRRCHGPHAGDVHGVSSARARPGMVARCLPELVSQSCSPS